MFNPVQTRYDGSTFRSVSHGYADLLTGDWEFDGLDRTARIATIQAIINLMEGLMKTGWTEHTNDWDWRISVTWGDAKLVAGTYDGDAPDYSESSWTDQIELRYDEVTPYENWHFLVVTEFRNSHVEGQNDDHEVLIPIDQIRTITVGEA